MQERLGFNTFLTGEATPAVWEVLSFKGTLIRGGAPSSSSPSSQYVSIKLIPLGELKSTYSLPGKTCPPHVFPLSPTQIQRPLRRWIPGGRGTFQVVECQGTLEPYRGGGGTPALRPPCEHPNQATHLRLRCPELSFGHEEHLQLLRIFFLGCILVFSRYRSLGTTYPHP